MSNAVARHFNVIGHEACTLCFMVIEVVTPLRKGGDKRVVQREAYCIHHLKN